jgi:hypothetical protein
LAFFPTPPILVGVLCGSIDSLLERIKDRPMPLLLEEVIPGTVAILETQPLLSNHDVRRSGDGLPFRSGPFLCAQVHDGHSTWLSITTRRDPGGLRLELRTEWLLEGSELWRSAPQYVNDARKPFIGPNAAFVLAGANELPHRPHLRPRVSQEGIEAAVAEMAKYRVNVL